MRIWKNDAGDLLTDEQVLRHIATFGSLLEAAKYEGITLISNRGPIKPARSLSRGNSKSSPKLADYLEKEF